MFGGYHGYLAAPADVIIRHELRIKAKWQAEREMQEDVEKNRDY